MKRITTAYVAMNPHLCMACWECVEKCPKQVIGKTGFFLHKHVVFENADACIGCLKCIKTCPNGVFFKLDKTVFDRKINRRTSFRIERLLPMAFLASAITGIGLHIAGHGTSHEVWHNWGAAHTLASFLWLLSTAIHVKRHRLWYKTLVSKGITKHRWVTILLSVLFPIVAITGIWLIACVKGAHTPIGLLHYKLGILLLASSLIHALHRK
ncbi:4Fe-4S binding protein [Alistipes ihumii]|uniref:4Fe-4S binding protein n=1 Tax=Alistipes ihumii TaxID=1470347 RepID=UPI003AB6944E